MFFATRGPYGTPLSFFWFCLGELAYVHSGGVSRGGSVAVTDSVGDRGKVTCDK